MAGHWVHIEKGLSKHATLPITKNYCLKSDQSFRKRRCCEMLFADGDGAPIGEEKYLKVKKIRGILQHNTN